MTREEAMRQLIGLKGFCWHEMETEENGCSIWNDDIDAIDMAIAALREQEERSKWCEKCRDESTEHHGIATATTGSRTIYRAKFCPKCGRRLEEV